MATVDLPSGRTQSLLAVLNTRGHKIALYGFMFIVLAHWAEHLTQAFQIWVLDWPRPKAGGVLGVWFPWLVTSEWLHYGYAIVMLVGLIVLRPGFTGRARTWWSVALWIQVWHHVEHLLLLLQAVTGSYLFGAKQPTSILQLVILRPELHLIYNALVTIPMVIAVVYHLRPSAKERDQMQCSCATTGPTG
jgi:hypothetical protein